MKELIVDTDTWLKSRLSLQQYVVLQLVHEERLEDLKVLEDRVDNLPSVLSFLSSNLYIYGTTIEEATCRQAGRDLFHTTTSKVTEVIEHFNKVANKRFSTKSPSNVRFITGRLMQGYTVEDCKRVIDMKTAEWKDDPKMSLYLRIETLFNDTKFQGYINQAGVSDESWTENMV